MTTTRTAIADTSPGGGAKHEEDIVGGEEPDAEEEGARGTEPGCLDLDSLSSPIARADCDGEEEAAWVLLGWLCWLGWNKETLSRYC